ncbi:MAG: hypothetical protein OXJ52_03440 [Oligoflexia bacterium]|nr:hypothetical protein [Oligoflexia bacterium]
MAQQLKTLKKTIQNSVLCFAAGYFSRSVSQIQAHSKRFFIRRVFQKVLPSSLSQFFFSNKFNVFLLLVLSVMMCSLMGCITQRKYVKYRFKKEEKRYDKRLKWNPSKTAIIVVDMWDKHWCLPSEKMAVLLAKKIDPFLSLLRDKGVQVFFAPSGTTQFYADTANYKRVKKFKRLFQEKLDWFYIFKDEPNMPLKIGCEDKGRNLGTDPWTKQSQFLKIKENDLISDNATDIINILMNKRVNLVLYAGAHSNGCVVSQPFGMRNLKKKGFQVALIRDLTDSFTQKNRLFPFQKERNKIIIDHIESYIAPTIHSSQFKNISFF